jgi:hypothetical protein
LNDAPWAVALSGDGHRIEAVEYPDGHGVPAVSLSRGHPLHGLWMEG